MRYLEQVRRIGAVIFLFFFFPCTATTEIYTLSLHDALPISRRATPPRRHAWILRHMNCVGWVERSDTHHSSRSEEHTSELQSRFDLVCRLLLEKKKSAPRKSDEWVKCANQHMDEIARCRPQS